MTQLKTKSGTETFKAVVETVEGVTLHKEDGKVIAKLDGTTIGEVRVAQVLAGGKEVKVSSLVGDIDPTTLIGKDPTTLTQEELIALTTYLQELAAGAAPAKKESKPASKKPAKQAEPEEDEDDEDEDGFELPEGLDTYEAIAALGVKELWAKIGKHVAAEAGIKARTPKDEMLEALAEYFELEAAEEEEEEAPKAKAKGKGKTAAPVEDDEEFEDEDDDEFDDEDDEEEEDEDDIDEDDDEEEDEDDIDEDDIDEDDIDDEDEEEDDEEEFDEDEEEFDEDEDDEDEVTEEDVDALFEAGNKAAIVMFCKEHGITLPKKKMSAATIKQIIKDELFGDDE